MNGFAQFLFWTLCFAFIMFGAYLIWQQNNAGAGIALTAGFICAFFANLEKFASFKGLGVEATLKVEETVKEAESAIAEIRKLSISLSDPIFHSVVAAGRMGAFDWSEKIKMLNRIEENLCDLNVDQDSIVSLRRHMDRYLAMDVFDIPTHVLTNLCSQRMQEYIEAQGANLGTIPPDKLEHVRTVTEFAQNQVKDLQNLNFSQSENIEGTFERCIDGINQCEVFSTELRSRVIQVFYEYKSYLDTSITQRIYVPQLRYDYQKRNQKIEELTKMLKAY